ncbi:TrkA C-terminal domain-containing protein [Actinophytocola sediminis]
MDIEVSTRDLPGLGTRYEIGCADGSRISVVVRHNGMRDLYTFEPGADTPSSSLQLTDAQARALSAVLAGVHFRPTGDEAPAAIGGVAIDWVTVVAPDHALDDLAAAHPEAAVMVLVRGEHTTMRPAGEILRAGDRLLVAGTGAALTALRAQLTVS